MAEGGILKVFSFTALSTLVKMLTGLISVKVVAIIIGPAGIALLGQLNNFTTIIMTVASGGISNGITKYIAEYRDSEEKVKILLSTGIRIIICCSFICGLLLISFHSFLSRFLMQSPDYGYVFFIFGMTVFLYALNLMINSILNGYKEFKKYITINIIGSIVGLLFSLALVFILGLKGALISAVTFQSVIFFISLWLIRKYSWVKPMYFKEKFDKAIAKKYFHYTIMTFVTAATLPVSQLLLRGYVISEISSVEAGWWEAMNRISNMYLLVITSSLSVYYLPRLSELQKRSEIKEEIYKAYKLIIPMLLVGFTFIYLFRFFIIRILFTTEFLPMSDLFIWQLIGDFFKISSWLLAFLMVAKSRTTIFVSTEFLFSALFISLGFLFIKLNGVVGITQAYMINYIIYLFLMVFFYKKNII